MENVMVHEKQMRKFPKCRPNESPLHFYNRMTKLQSQKATKQVKDIKKSKTIRKYPKISIYSVKNKQIVQTITRSVNIYDEKKQVIFPVQITSILYRQNITNYNPYLSVLNQISNEKNLQLKERIRDLCLVGIGRDFMKTKKFRKIPQYSPVNILIREYMIDLVAQEVQKKSEDNHGAVFIFINQSALSFNKKKYPQKLMGIVSQQQYSQKIKEVNRIIEKQYIWYKVSSYRGGLDWTRSELAVIIFGVVMFVVFCLTRIAMFPFLILLVMIVGFVFGTMQCTWRLKSLVQTKNVSQKIMGLLQNYFKSISNEQVLWRLGKDFYWIEIHYIIKKKKYQNILGPNKSL